jgi:GLPGLI family protein
MKCIISLFFIFVYLCNTNAQKPVWPPYPRDISNEQTVDSGNIRIWYALNAVDINKPETYDDLQRLEIGVLFSKYYSCFVYNSDSLCTDWGKKHPNARSAPTRMGDSGKDGNWSEYYYSEYFKNLSQNVFTEYARMPMRISNYQCSETIPVQNWSIEDDTLTIAAYPCQKAACRFRGRDYIAWFAPDIPINNGPWKFGGLPGLILKVYDKDNQYVFECIKIENCREKYPIKMYNYESYGKIEREKMLQLQKKIHEDYYTLAGMVVTSSSGPPNKKVPYVPLEME